MKMQVSARRHRDPARLQGEELAAPDGDFRVVDRAAEHAAGEGDFACRQRAFPADRASRPEVARRFRQRSSPAARTSAGKLSSLPPTKVTVTFALPPAAIVSASWLAITCRPPGSSLTVSPAGMSIWKISSIEGWLFQVPIWWSVV